MPTTCWLKVYVIPEALHALAVCAARGVTVRRALAPKSLSSSIGSARLPEPPRRKSRPLSREPR